MSQINDKSKVINNVRSSIHSYIVTCDCEPTVQDISNSTFKDRFVSLTVTLVTQYGRIVDIHSITVSGRSIATLKQ